MLTIFTYSEQDGLTTPRDATVLRSLLADKSRITWVDIEKPTLPETELLDIAFNFHPLAIEDCLTSKHQPKIDDYGEYIFLIIHEFVPQSSEKDFKTVEVDLFLGKNFLVTYHRPKLRSIEIIREKIGFNPKPLFRSSDFLLAKLLDEVVNLYIPLLDQFDRKIIALEDTILQEQARNFLPEIFGIKRNLTRLKAVAIQQLDTITQLARSGYDVILPVSLPYLANVRDNFDRVCDRMETHRDAASNLVEAYLMTSSNKTNEVMKVLTIFASMMLPLTVITGIYGMNFDVMPELNWKYGYLFALGLMAAIGGGLIYYFRKKKWL